MARNTSNSSQKAGPGCMMLFGLVFAGMGAAAMFLVGSNFLKNAETYTWDKVPCEFESVEIAVQQSKENAPFELKVSYSYNYEGRNFTSNQVARSDRETGDDYLKFALKRRSMLSERGGVCWVNPDMPGEAVIERRGFSSSLMLLIPIPFLAIGIAIFIGGIRGARNKKAVDQGKVESISSEAKNTEIGSRVLLGIGVLFLLIGGALLWPTGIKPISEMVASKSWVETPCQIIWSRVQVHSGDDGDTYSPDIFYKYEFEGETYRSNRYSIMAGSSSGRKSKQKIVASYPARSTQVCYVDPDLPERSLLKPGFSAFALLVLFPVVFWVVGFFMIRAAFRKSSPGSVYRAKSSVASVPVSEPIDAPVEETGPLTLYPGKGRLAGLIFFFLFATGWNAGIWFAIVEGDMAEGIFGKLFSIPFVLVGVAVAIGFFYMLGTALNPKPIITVTPGTPRLGEPFSIKWQTEKGANRLGSLKIYIEGTEHATYRRGTNTHTDNEVFYCVLAVEEFSLDEFRMGETSITLPAELIGTFELDNNKILWSIVVKGDIPLWPDVNDRHKITVLPSRQAAV